MHVRNERVLRPSRRQPEAGEEEGASLLSSPNFAAERAGLGRVSESAHTAG